MATPPLKVKGIEIPKDQEKALFDAYRQDIAEKGDVALFASELNLTINVYEPSALPAGLRAPLQQGQKLHLGGSERFSLSSSKTSVGKGLPVVNLLYNKFTKRYEVLQEQNGQFVRKGNGGGEEDSLYHCMVNVMEPSLASNRLSSRIAFYKTELTSRRNLSDSNIRETLERNIIPGSNVENELQRASLARENYVIRLKGLVAQLRDELDTVEPPQRHGSLYSGKFQVTRHLLGTLQYEFDRKTKDYTFEQLAEEHLRIQRDRLRILQEGYQNAYKWQEKDVYIRALIKGNEDYKAVALVAVMDDTTLDVNERFRLTTNLVTNTDPEKLKREYMRIRGSADPDKLETDLKAKFYVEGAATSPLRHLGGLSKYFSVGEGHKLQFSYLKAILETGKQSPSAKLALKLGLLYRGAEIRNLTPKQKDEIQQIVDENLGELAAIADVDESGNMQNNEDEFLQAAFDTLKRNHSGVLGEMQLKLRHSVTTRPITGIDINTISSMTVTDGAGKSLMEVLYDSEKKEIRTVGPSPNDTTTVRKKILKWIKGCTEEELKKFIQAADLKRRKSPNVYQVVWSLIHRHMERASHKGDWKAYFKGMAEAQVRQEPQEMKPFYEVEAFLKYKKSRGPFLAFKEKKQTLAKVLNMLSTSDGWDPRAKLARFVENHPDLKNHENYEEYKNDPTLWLTELLQDAGVDDEGLEQANLLLYAGGSYNGDEATDPDRNIDNYLSLKRKARRTYVNALLHGLSRENILTTIGNVKAGSLEHWLISNDKKLLKQIRGQFRDHFKSKRTEPGTDQTDVRNKLTTAWSGICQALDLGSKWQNLDLDSDTENSQPAEEEDDLLSEPPSKEDLKAFKDKYKDEESKKKLWVGKYVLTYSLAKEQSTFNMSDRKELLKVVYKGQLEGFTGEELMRILDDIDPTIRNSLTRTPPLAWKQPQKAAHAQLKKFLIDGEKILFKDFINVAKGLFNDYSVIDFVVSDLPPEKSAALWFTESYDNLKTWSEARLEKTLKLHGNNARTTGAPSAETRSLEADIADLDKKISQHEFKIDPELKAQLERLTLDGKTEEFERKLKRKLGEKMLCKPESFEDLHIPPFELAQKGSKVLAEADISYQNYLVTGVGYHRFSVTGLESYAEGSNFLRNLWKTACAQPTGTAAEREQEEQELLKSLKKSHDDLMSSLDTWKDKQDEYTKRIVNVVSQTLSVALYTALAASGIGTVGFVVLGAVKSTLTTVITKAVEKALSRRNDVLPREIIKEAMVTAVSSIPGILASVDYGDVPGLKKIINSTIGSSLIKGQISYFSKAIVGGVGEVLVATGAGNFEMTSQAFKDNIVKRLQDYNPTQPAIYKTVLQSLSLQASKEVSNMIKAGITDMDEAAFKKLDPAKQAELTAKFKPLQILFKNIYNTAMTNKGYDLLSKGAAFVPNLPFADDTEVDKNPIDEEEKKKLAIANSLVEALAEKGLKVDSDFDYGDAEKLMEQIADKMPGTKLTQDEIRTMTAEVNAEFVEKQNTLTDEEKQLPTEEQKNLLVDRAKEEKLKQKRAPWITEVSSMKARFDTEADAVKVEAERKVEEESKQLEADVQAVQDGNTVTETILDSENRVESEEKTWQNDESKYVVAQAFAARLYGRKSKKNREAFRKKLETQWRLHRNKKKNDTVQKSGITGESEV